LANLKIIRSGKRFGRQLVPAGAMLGAATRAEQQLLHPRGTKGTETAHVHFSYRKLQKSSGQGNSWPGNMLMSSNNWSLEFQEFPPPM